MEQFRQTNQFDYDTLARFFQASLGARVVVFEPLGQDTVHTVGDSNPVSSEDVREDPVARPRSRPVRRDRRGRSGRPTSRSRGAARQRHRGPPRAPLQDTLSTARRVQRVLISGIVALLIAWFAGSLAAMRLTHRIRRLEVAAGRIAAGDFDQEIVDPVEDEVGELARAFDRMRLRLAHLDRARREFIGNASHELRTPLFSLGGFLELMADEDVDPAIGRSSSRRCARR